MIVVKNLAKNYEYYKKEEGLYASIKNLFQRKKLVKEAIRNISFQVDRGEIVGFLGPNGAGKTTTLKILSGILTRTDGHVSVAGFDPGQRQNEFKRTISIVMGQKSQLLWDLPAIESFQLTKRIYDLDNADFKKTLTELLDVLDVGEKLNVQVRRLSLGERMKMEIINALLHRPTVLFLDEPTIGLDILSQKNLRAFLSAYNRKEKTTIVLTSHYLRDVEELCERVILIDKGSILYDGLIDQINRERSGRKIIKAKSLKPIEVSAFKHLGTLSISNEYEMELEVQKDRVNETVKALLDLSVIDDITVEDIPLESIVAHFFDNRLDKENRIEKEKS